GVQPCALPISPVADVLSLLAAVAYIAVTIALVRGGRPSPLARVLCLAELAGVLIVGTLTFLVPSLFPDATVWSHYGQGYGFVPLLLPLVALFYLRRGGQRDVATGPSA